MVLYQGFCLVVYLPSIFQVMRKFLFHVGYNSWRRETAFPLLFYFLYEANASQLGTLCVGGSGWCV